MGCGGSKEGTSLVPPNEEPRKDVPPRVELPFGAGWRSCTLGKPLGTFSGAYELRVDNGGPKLMVVLQKPDELCTFDAFSEYMSMGDTSLNDDDDAFEQFKKLLPLGAGQPVDVKMLDGGGAFFQGRICENHQYKGGERLLVLIDDRLVDATVVDKPLNAGSLHTLSIEPAARQGAEISRPSQQNKVRQLNTDLNSFNHCQQLFSSVFEYEETRVTYLRKLVDKLAYVQDAITGNRLSIDDQVSQRRLPSTAPRHCPRPSHHAPSSRPAHLVHR